MRIYELLEMNKGGLIEVVSIHKLPYVDKKRAYSKTYFNEERIDDLLASGRYRAIKNRTISSFNVIGGGMDPLELCIYIPEKE